MNRRTIIYLSLIIGYLSSCNFSNKKDAEPKSPLSKGSNTDSLNSANIISKYKAELNWDTLSYTYQIKDKFENNDSVPLAIKAAGVDIIKIDSSYYLKLRKQHRWLITKEVPFKEILLFLKISKNQLDEIRSNMKTVSEFSLDSENGCFIIKPTSINSSDIKVFDETETESPSKVISNKSVLIIRGSLIDYHLYKNSL
ncbi:MAG: hypothetical protein RL108_107 [Bacteroidota bacterium]|jgi:hypothetical protein